VGEAAGDDAEAATGGGLDSAPPPAVTVATMVSSLPVSRSSSMEGLLPEPSTKASGVRMICAMVSPVPTTSRLLSRAKLNSSALPARAAGIMLLLSRMVVLDAMGY
jgi:hypothetical protein